MTSLQDIKSALREQITDVSVLRDHLTAVHQQIQSSSSSDSNFEKSIAAVQSLLLENILPTWSAILDEDHQIKHLLEGCFAPGEINANVSEKPPRFSSRNLATAYAGYHTLSTTLSNPKTSPHLSPFITHLTSALVIRYGLAQLWDHAFMGPQGDSRGKFAWEEAVKMVVALPGRVMNAYGRAREAAVQGINDDDVDRLNGRGYFDKAMWDLEALMLSVADGASEQDISSLAYAINRLIRAGLLIPPSPSSADERRPSFFTPIFPSLLSHLNPSPAQPKSTHSTTHYPPGFWPCLLLELHESDIASLGWSFLLHLTHHISPPTSHVCIPHAIAALRTFFGSAVRGKGKEREVSDVCQAFVEGLFARGKGREAGGVEAVETRCRVVVGWIAEGGDSAIKNLIERVLEVWTDPKSIKYSLFAWQLYITQLLLLAISHLPSYHPYLVQTSFKPSFLASMQEYLSHSDGAIRRLGMLVAEVLSEKTIPDDGAPPPANKSKGKAKAKAKDDEVEELERMLSSLGDEENRTNQAGAAPSGKQRRRLDFGREIWDGFGQGKEECRRLRALVHGEDDEIRLSDERDLENTTIKSDLLGWDEQKSLASDPPESKSSRVENDNLPRGRSQAKSPPPKRTQPAEPDSDDESLSGYSSSANSSRSPSPTPSYLEEVARDPMSNTNTREKVQRPVYIIQLIELLRAREEPDKLEVGLKWGESLIRRKRHFGKELEENSIFLCQVLCALSDPYDIEEFEERRQSMLVALTACVPKRIAPYLIEQYFIGQYSMIQRSAILTALSMAARETAGFSTLPRPNIPKRVDFPSKLLPPALHQRYLTEQDIRGATHASLLLQTGKEDVMDVVLRKKGNSDSEAIRSRQRQLRPGQAQSLGAGGLNAIAETIDLPVIPFKDVAAEYFILPMINRFWTYFQDELARESRAAPGRRGFTTGSGMILSPMALTHFISALTIMLHAAQHSPAFLAILVPEALELAIALGTQMGLSVEVASPDGGAPAELESDVVAASLELALVCISGAKDVDGGRSLVKEHITNVMAAGEWASGIFGKEQKGESTTTHKGGMKEDRIHKTAAGIVLTVSNIVEAVRR